MTALSWFALGWLAGIPTAVLARWIVCVVQRKREARKTVAAYRKMVHTERPWGELERRRMLETFVKRKGNAGR